MEVAAAAAGDGAAEWHSAVADSVEKSRLDMGTTDNGTSHHIHTTLHASLVVW